MGWGGVGWDGVGWDGMGWGGVWWGGVGRDTYAALHMQATQAMLGMRWGAGTRPAMRNCGISGCGILFTRVIFIPSALWLNVKKC